MRPVLRLTIATVTVGVLITGCGNDLERRAPAGTVVVAAFGFSESRLLAELYSQAMEAQGIPVERAFDLASREVVEPALEQGVVGFVPEYSGTALEFVTRGAGQASADPAMNHRLLAEALASRGITVLDAAPAQNQNAVAVTAETAARLNVSAISDLKPLAPGLVFGGPPECPERKFCLAGLRNVYGLTFKEFVPLDAAGPLTVGALEGEEVDAGVLFSTSPAVAAKGLVLLEDDLRLQPAENVVPVVRTELLDRHGAKLRDAINGVSAKLTTSELIELNRRVEINSEVPAAVATDWLRRQGLLSRR